jgi:nucleoside-diphosphate-sugar epimerase
MNGVGESMKILVLGAGGQIAHWVIEILKSSHDVGTDARSSTPQKTERRRSKELDCGPVGLRKGLRDAMIFAIERQSRRG